MSGDSIVFNESEPGALMKLYSAVGKAAAAFPDLPRTATGQVGKDRKFKYAPYHKVVRCIKPTLSEQGITFLQPLHSEEDGKVSITLIVAGHGAVIASTVKFNKNDDVKIFGADVTYHKRYQLTAFFGLEGDPDADDFEDSVVESTTKTVAKTEQKPAAKPADSVVVSENASQASENDSGATKVKGDTRSIGEKLNDAMKQLNWKIPEFDAFCKEYPEEFPDFISAAKLNPAGKVKLYELLVLHKGIAPF